MTLIWACTYVRGLKIVLIILVQFHTTVLHKGIPNENKKVTFMANFTCCTKTLVHIQSFSYPALCVCKFYLQSFNRFGENLFARL